MQKKILTIVLTVLLFLSAVALGISTVFRVDGVTVEATLLSVEAKAQLPQIQQSLEEAYKKKSTFSVDEEKAHALIAEYSYLRVVGFEKSYPNRLTVRIVEESEVYEVCSGEVKYILGREGVVVGIGAAAETTEGARVRIEGVQVTGEKGGLLSGDDRWQSVLTFCRELDMLLGGIGRNIVKVEVLQNVYEDIFRLYTREGVKIYAYNPSVLTKEKASAVVERYLSLSDGERMVGMISAIDAEGLTSAVYKETDELSALK